MFLNPASAGFFLFFQRNNKMNLNDTSLFKKLKSIIETFMISPIAAQQIPAINFHTPMLAKKWFFTGEYRNNQQRKSGNDPVAMDFSVEKLDKVTVDLMDEEAA